MAGIFISCFPIFSPNMSGISDNKGNKDNVCQQNCTDIFVYFRYLMKRSI